MPAMREEGCFFRSCRLVVHDSKVEGREEVRCLAMSGTILLHLLSCLQGKTSSESDIHSSDLGPNPSQNTGYGRQMGANSGVYTYI